MRGARGAIPVMRASRRAAGLPPWRPDANIVSYLERTRLSYGTSARGANERTRGDADRNAEGNTASGGRKRDECLCGATGGWRAASGVDGVSRGVWGERAHTRSDRAV